MKIHFALLGFLFLFTASCGGVEINTSTESFLSNLTGVYKTSYEDTNYEIWIEEIENAIGRNEYYISVLLFKKDKASDIQSFLTKYPDVKSYSDSICNYVKENPNKFSGYDLKTSPSLYYDISADQVWKWDKLGAVSFFILPSNNKASSFDAVSVEHYIDLPENDEHALKSFDTNSEGKATKIHLLETGFIKKIWNYILAGPSLKIEKTSSEPKGLLKQYLRTVEETRKAFVEAGENNRSYCDKE